MWKIQGLSRVLRLGFLLAVVIGFSGAIRAQYLQPGKTAPAPEFVGVTEWINSEPLTMAKLRGKVVIVHFWTFGCFNCVNNYPHYRNWQERFSGKDVVMIGIHTPETDGERDIKRIKEQAEKNGLKFAIAVDNGGKNWKAWNNRCWPAVYVIDKRGTVRYGWEGELNYKGMGGEAKVRKLVDELLLERP